MQLQKSLNPNDDVIFMKFAVSGSNVRCQTSILLQIVTPYICSFATLTDSAVYYLTNLSNLVLFILVLW